MGIEPGTSCGPLWCLLDWANLAIPRDTSYILSTMDQFGSLGIVHSQWKFAFVLDYAFFSSHWTIAKRKMVSLILWCNFALAFRIAQLNKPLQYYNTFDKEWKIDTALHYATCQTLIGCTITIVSQHCSFHTPVHLFTFIEPLTTRSWNGRMFFASAQEKENILFFIKFYLILVKFDIKI